MTPLLPCAQIAAPDLETTRVRGPQDGFPALTFEPRELAMLASPAECLNDWCINGCIPLLFSDIQPVYANQFAILSTHELPRIQHDATDQDLWRVTSRTGYWTKKCWIIPIHRPAPENHWVLCIADFSCRELRLFDSVAQQKPWEANVPVRLLGGTALMINAKFSIGCDATDHAFVDDCEEEVSRRGST